MAKQPDFDGILAAAADRVRACAEANLALRAGLNALEDARIKLRERLTSLPTDEGDKREGLRESLIVVGHLISLTQSQVPVSEGQLMEARYTHGSLCGLRLTSDEGDEPLAKAG